MQALCSSWGCDDDGGKGVSDDASAGGGGRGVSDDASVGGGGTGARDDANAGSGGTGASGGGDGSNAVGRGAGLAGSSVGCDSGHSTQAVGDDRFVNDDGFGNTTPINTAADDVAVNGVGKQTTVLPEALQVS